MPDMEATPSADNYVDWQGNRWWMTDSEDLFCAPLNADGTPDLDSITEPEELHERVRDALTLLLFAGGGW